MGKPVQTRMFQTDDLPLFSGTAPRAQEQTFEAPPPDPQPPLLCRWCGGSGMIRVGCADDYGAAHAFCSCEAGERRRKEKLG